jgi:hypothetical protein
MQSKAGSNRPDRPDFPRVPDSAPASSRLPAGSVGGTCEATPARFWLPARRFRNRRASEAHSAHFTVSRTTSSIDVTPSRTLHSPLSRSVYIPSSRAVRRRSIEEAPVRIISRSPSLTSMTS